MPTAKRGNELSAEEAEAVNTMLQDFHRQWQKRKADMSKEDETFAQQMRALGKMFLLKLPRADRELKACDVLISCDPNRKAEGVDVGDCEAADRTVDRQIELVKREMRSVSKKQQQQQVRKALAASRGLKTPSAAQKTSSLMMPPPAPTDTVRRSSRKRPGLSSALTDMMITPLVGKRTGQHQQPMTPLITPKFDMSRPLPRSVMRLAKPNETLVSMSGSPVYVGAAKKGKKGGDYDGEATFKIGLGKGKTMVLPVHGDSELELEDEDREKLIAIKKTLNNLKI